jgi:hypothetical protein
MEVRTPGRNQPLLLCFSADECDAGARGETGLAGDPSTDSGGKLMMIIRTCKIKTETSFIFLHISNKN